MTLATLIPLLISVSMGLIVLSLGLGASLKDATYLLKHPGLLVRSVASMNVIMPILAAIVVALFELHPAIEIAIVALAFSPVPPILPNKELKAGGSVEYVVSLLVIMALLAIVIVPVGVRLLRMLFPQAMAVPVQAVVPVVFVSIIMPLVIGMILHSLTPAFAARSARWISLAGTILLVVALMPVLIRVWPLLHSMIGNGTLLVLALFAVIGLALGHFLGGPIDSDRTVLALATSTRHPGVALAIAAATFPEERAVLAVVLWHLIVGAVVPVPYVRWRKRVHGIASPDGAAKTKEP